MILTSPILSYSSRCMYYFSCRFLLGPIPLISTSDWLVGVALVVVQERACSMHFLMDKAREVSSFSRLCLSRSISKRSCSHQLDSVAQRPQMFKNRDKWTIIASVELMEEVVLVRGCVAVGQEIYLCGLCVAFQCAVTVIALLD